MKLNYTEAHVRSAIRAYWKKQIGPVFPVVTFLMFAFLVHLWLDGERGWIVGALGLSVGLAVSVMVSSYFIQVNRALRRLRRMKTPVAALELGEERFKITSDIGASEVDWSLVKKVWRFEECWLLFFSAGEFMTLPIADIPLEARAFIESRVKAYGGKIV